MMETRASLPGLTAAGAPLSSAGAGGGSAGAWPVARPAMDANTGATTAAPMSRSLRFIGGIVAESRAIEAGERESKSIAVRPVRVHVSQRPPPAHYNSHASQPAAFAQNHSPHLSRPCAARPAHRNAS